MLLLKKKLNVQKVGILSVVFFCFFGVTYAIASTSTYCTPFKTNINATGNVCFSLSKNLTRYQLLSTFENISGLQEMRCYVKTSESIGAPIYYIPMCNDEFSYDGSLHNTFTIYAFFNNQSKTLTYNIYHNVWNVKGEYEYKQNSLQETTNASDVFFRITPRTYYPKVNEAFDARITAYTKDNLIFTSYTGAITIAIQEYRNAYRQEASSYDYSLSTTSYSYASKDYGQANVRVVFYKPGTYRLYVTDRTSAKSYSLPLYVSGGEKIHESASRARSLSVWIMKNSKPLSSLPLGSSQRASVDVLVIAVDKNAMKVKNYAAHIYLFVQSKRSDGQWVLAKKSAYTLKQNPFYMLEGSSIVKDAVTFYEPGTYRVIASDSEIIENAGIVGKSRQVVVKK